MAMYSLGGFAFKSSTMLPRSVKRATSYHWKKVDRLGREPARQAVGLGDDSIVFEGVFYPSEAKEVGSIETLAELRDLGAKMDKQMLVDGDGNVYGWWVIDKVTDGRTHLWPNSQPRKIEFTLNISPYGADQ